MRHCKVSLSWAQNLALQKVSDQVRSSYDRQGGPSLKFFRHLTLTQIGKILE